MPRKRNHRSFKKRYAVLGEGITEQWYLSFLKDYKKYKYIVRPRLFDNIGLKKAERFIDDLLDEGYDYITFFTDYDTIVSQEKRARFDALINKYKSNNKVFICESMPSIEIWFLLHFIYTTREFVDYDSLKSVLRNYLPGYEKTNEYLKDKNWFCKLIQNQGFCKAKANAIKLFENRKQGNIGRHFPYTKMHLAIEQFEKQKHA